MWPRRCWGCRGRSEGGCGHGRRGRERHSGVHGGDRRHGGRGRRARPRRAGRAGARRRDAGDLRRGTAALPGDAAGAASDHPGAVHRWRRCLHPLSGRWRAGGRTGPAAGVRAGEGDRAQRHGLVPAHRTPSARGGGRGGLARAAGGLSRPGRGGTAGPGRAGAGGRRPRCHGGDPRAQPRLPRRGAGDGRARLCRAGAVRARADADDPAGDRHRGAGPGAALDRRPRRAGGASSGPVGTGPTPPPTRST